MIRLAEQLGSLLKQNNWLLATAESCTGGSVAQWVTAVPGSSGWFERGFVTYSNQSKIEMLGVNAQTIETFGAVSRETALEMAVGAIRHSHAQVSLAITGIAGPTGGSISKPVGTVWIAWLLPFYTEAYAEVFHFSGNRELVRHLACQEAMFKLSYALDCKA